MDSEVNVKNSEDYSYSIISAYHTGSVRQADFHEWMLTEWNNIVNTIQKSD